MEISNKTRSFFSRSLLERVSQLSGTLRNTSRDSQSVKKTARVFRKIRLLNWADIRSDTLGCKLSLLIYFCYADYAWERFRYAEWTRVGPIQRQDLVNRFLKNNVIHWSAWMEKKKKSRRLH